MKQEIIEPIGFFLEGENIVVANPCTIPIDFIEDAIKTHKETKCKNVTAVFYLQLPINFPRPKSTKPKKEEKKSE